MKPRKTKHIEAEFLRQWKPLGEALKKSIKAEIKKGLSAKKAVNNAFRRHDVRGRLRTMILNGVVKAAKLGMTE